MTTQQSEIDVLKAQVRTLDAALTKQSRTFRRVSYGFVLLIIAGCGVATTSMQSVPDVIQAKRFEVINDQGQVMVGLSQDSDGGLLSLLNKNGEVTFAAPIKEAAGE
jgi:hypothetical protein